MSILPSHVYFDERGTCAFPPQVIAAGGFFSLALIADGLCREVVPTSVSYPEVLANQAVSACEVNIDPSCIHGDPRTYVHRICDGGTTLILASSHPSYYE